ncbi:MAG: radical SAM protein [Thermosphaera sp.]
MSGIQVRASAGTLALLGLTGEFRIEELPATAYLLQHSPEGCRAGCAFCMQSRRLHSAHGGIRLGRVTWPAVELGVLLDHWRRVFKRLCLQTVVKPMFHEEALEIIRRFRSRDPDTPVSLAITPVPISVLKEAKALGVDALGIGLDASTRELFDKWGKPYSWGTYLRFIEKAVEVFGKGSVYVHVIAGLGEELSDIVGIMRHVYRAGGRIALFNLVDQRGGSRVEVGRYRLIQIARHLLELGHDPLEYLDLEGLRLKKKIPWDLRDAFKTSGCPGCNRPFYNESPRGALYNIPSDRALEAYSEKLRRELAGIGVLD